MTDAAICSIVMIFRDGERFIDEAIRSVVDQTSDAWELLLVDDGSVDASPRLARGWADRHPRIRYVTHPGGVNAGMSASRNLGVATSTGAWIAFLDCDDVLVADAVATRLAAVERWPDVDVVVHPTLWWSSWNGASGDHVMPLPDVGIGLVVEPPRLFEAIYGDPGWWKVLTMCGITIRRTWWEAAGGMVDEFRGLFEDQALYTKIARTARVVVDDHVLAQYRQHDDSACAVGVRDRSWATHGTSPSQRAFLAWLDRHVGPADPVRPVVDRNLAAAAAYDRTSARVVRAVRARAAGLLPRAVRAQRHRRRVAAIDATTPPSVRRSDGTVGVVQRMEEPT